MVWSLPLGGAAGSARRFSFHFHLFLSASWPRSEVSGSPLRDIFVVFCRSPTLGSFFSRLDSGSESLADWSAPAIPSPLPPDGRRWSSPSSSRRCPVLRRDRSGAAGMCVRARRGRVSDSNFTSDLMLADLQPDASGGGARRLSACFCEFCGTDVFQCGVFPCFPRIAFVFVCVCVCVCRDQIVSRIECPQFW